MIKHRILGRTGLSVSELCLGTLNFGWKTDETTSFDILDAFYQAGGNFLQAAALSSSFPLPSASTNSTEEIIGRWMLSRKIPRRDLVLGTRISLRSSADSDRAMAQTVRERVRESMRRLETDYLDLLLFEWTDGPVSVQQTVDAFDVAVRDCYVRYIGASNFPAWRVADCMNRAFHRNQPRMEVLQSDYSLMTRARFEPETRSLCDDKRLGFVATSPLAGGFLTRRSPFIEFSALSLYERRHPRFENTYGHLALGAVFDVAARLDTSPAQVSLAWVLHNPTVSSALIGVRSADELHELIRGAALNLSNPNLEQLDTATAAEEVIIPLDDASPVSRPRIQLPDTARV